MKNSRKETAGNTKNRSSQEALTLHKSKYSAFVKHYFFLIPLSLIPAFVPMIVRMGMLEIPGSIENYWVQDVNADFFSYYKSIALIGLTLVSGWIVVSGFLTKSRPLKASSLEYRYWVWAPLLLMALLTTLSTIFSEYYRTALSGFPDRYEGMWVWLCYIAMVFITYQTVRKEEHLRFITAFIMVSASLLSIHGLMQFFEYDLFHTDFGLQLIVPEKFSEVRQQLDFTFGPYTIYSTMFNTNYVGSYFAMLVPLSVSLYAYWINRSEIALMKYGFALFPVLIFANLVGSRSRAGWVGAFLALLLLVVLYHSYILKKPRVFIFFLASFIAASFGLNLVSGDILSQRMGLAGILQTQLPEEEISTALVDLQTRHDGLDILWSSKSLHLYFDSAGYVNAVDQAGQTVHHSLYKDGIENIHTVCFDDSRFDQIFVDVFQDSPRVTVFEGNRWAIKFFNSPEGFSAIGVNHELIDLVKPESFGFQGYEHIGTGRGYLFSRNIPMLKNTLVLGHGPDTYPMYFPQNDYAGKLLYLGSPYIIVDKPHNVYLQIGINQGVPALLAYLVLLLFYSWNSLKLYFKRVTADPSFLEAVGVGCFVAVVGYSVTGLFNDSIVSVAPVFWVLLGMGISVNEMIRRQETYTD